MAPIAGSEPGASAHASSAIPFARQETPWWCGAASLAMVYGSFGLRPSQAEVWAGIAADDHGDRAGVKAHRLGRDAIERGFAAAAFRASDPWGVLGRCAASGVRVVLDLPLNRWSGRRHFAVLAGVEGGRVAIHDPLLDGPTFQGRDEFLDLWGHTLGVWDSAAFGLVAIADRAASAPCPSCGLAQPPALPCRRCRRPMPLGIPAALGCLNPGCSACSWRLIFCPHCDNALSTRDGGRFGGAFPCEDDMTNPEDIRKLAQAFQAYQDKLAAAGERSPSPEIREQVESFQAAFKATLDQFSEAMHGMTDRLAAEEARTREKAAEAREKAAEVARAHGEALERIAARKAEKLAQAQAREQAREVDPLLGAKLRHQLLDEFGTRRDVAPAPSGEYGSALDYWPGS